jgi:1,2-diacylglycerol 3-alpha-glucosyltransferase
MKIALFTDTFFPQVNGVVQTVHNLAESLSSRGHDVCVFTVSSETPMDMEQAPLMHYEVVTLPSIPLLMYPGERMTAPIGLSLSKVKAFKPDIIHAHTPLTMGQEAYICARRFKVPLVGTHHTFFDHYLKIWHLDYQWARYISWKLTNQYYNRCALVITPTKALAVAMQEHGLDSPVEVTPNSIPHSDSGFGPRDKRSEEGKRTIVYMGRLSGEKDVDKVIDAYALIVRDSGAHNKATHLTIIGDGPYKNDLEKKAEELGISKHVTFTGFLRGRDLADELRKHDVFVTASKSENMPISILEAMTSGLPIVGVAALGMPELVHHGENGFLVTPDDVHAMAERIREILDDDALQERLARASLKLALLHDPDDVAAQHEKIYEKLRKNIKVPTRKPSQAD